MGRMGLRERRFGGYLKDLQRDDGEWETRWECAAVAIVKWSRKRRADSRAER